MSASEPFKTFEHAGWSDASRVLAYHRRLSDVTGQAIPALLDSGGVKAGDRVLDVACGGGYVTAAARERGADTVGVDFSAAQLDLARETYPDIQFLEGDAEDLPFPDASFDIVLNCFGFPHLAAPEKAAGEAFRVLKGGGRFAYASWAEPAKCLALAMVYDAIRAHGSLDVGLPAGPNFFAYGDTAYAGELLGAAGFVDVSAKDVPLVWRVSMPDAIFDTIVSGTVRAAAVLERQTPRARAEIKEYLHSRISPFQHNGGYEVPAPALVVAGWKP
jgi:SAM-dependent methyltransferase